MIVQLLMTLSARATTLPSEPPRAQVARADLAAEAMVNSRSYGIVTADGEDLPVTYYTLDILQHYLGRVDSGTVRLILPGGPLGDRWVHAGAPTLEAGEIVFFIGNINSDDVVRLTGWTRGLFVRSTTTPEVALLSDARRSRMGGVSCEVPAWPVRPLTDAPSGAIDGVPLTADEAVSVRTGPAFVENPTDYGLPWNDLLAAFASCIGQSGNAGRMIPGLRGSNP